MKSLRLFGLAALAALATIAFAGTTSALAESTALCAPGAAEEEAKEECGAEAMLLTHIHYVTEAGEKAKVLNGTFNVACDVLLLAESFVELAKPLLFFGTLTYTNCGGGCTITEENGPGEWRFLKVEGETAAVTPEYLVKVQCGMIINCRYKAEEELLGEGKGAYLAPEKGRITINEQALPKESGLLCPAAKLDIVLFPLVATHFVS